MSHEALEAEALVTRRSAVTMSVFIAVGCLLGILNSSVAERPLLLARVISVAWAIVSIAILAAGRKRPQLWTARAAFAAVPIPLFPTFWLLVAERTVHGLPFETFVRQELMCIVYGFATPPSAAISLVVIAAFTIDSLVLLWTIAPHSPLLAVQGWQPWTILAFGLCAMVLALYGAHRQRKEVALIVEVEHVASLQRLVHAYLAVCDLMSTPLQTLKISLFLLGARCPGAREITSAMARSVDRLQELKGVLTTEASKVELKAGMESFDPLQVLQAPRKDDSNG